MWVRSELKDRAKNVMNTCYWNAVLISFILSMLTGGGSGFSAGNSSRDVKDAVSSSGGSGMEELGILLPIIIATVIGIALVVLLLGALVTAFVTGPIEVGAKRFFMISREEKAKIGEIAFGFKNSYINVVKTQFLKNIFIALWTLLLIIPGIIKSYEYRMIPYIMAENPQIDTKDAFRLSKEMMMGEKWNTFLLDWSFLFWIILGLLTCGIVMVFYVSPYIWLTEAELYAVLREKLLGSGRTSTYELKGFGKFTEDVSYQ